MIIFLQNLMLLFVFKYIFGFFVNILTFLCFLELLPYLFLKLLNYQVIFRIIHIWFLCGFDTFRTVKCFFRNTQLSILIFSTLILVIFRTSPSPLMFLPLRQPESSQLISPPHYGEALIVPALDVHPRDAKHGFT